MPTFFYTAKTIDGQTQTGQQEAQSPSELSKTLRQTGLILVSNQLKSQQKPSLDLKSLTDYFVPVSLADKMMFARNLALMIDAGLSLNEALRLLVSQISNRKLAKTISQIEQRVRQGETFADSLNRQKKVFDELFINMVRVGETSGNLADVLRLIALQLKRDHDLQSKTKGAMIYPAVVITAMIGIGITMMIVVMPKLAATFADINVQLPWTTRLVIGTSTFLAKNWFIIPLFVINTVIFWRLSKNIIAIKKVFHWLILRSPVFGDLSRKINATRFCRVFSSMVDGGIPIIQAMKTSAKTLTNWYFQHALIQAADSVQKGDELSLSLKQQGAVFPVLVLQMMSVGENTGRLTEILNRLGDFYEEEITNTTKNLSSIIEPILMLVIGVAVAIFAISVIQPIYSMMNNI